MTSARSAVAAYAALAVLDTGLAGLSSPAAHQVRMVTKTLLMPALGMATHRAAAGRTSGLVRGVQVGQAFSWAGDVALQFRGDRNFLIGLGSFFAAHSAYIATFVSARDPEARLTAPGDVAAALTWAIAGPALAVAASRQNRALSVPVAAYAAVLTAMFATSTTLDRSIPAPARHRIVAGTALFLLSDTLLAAAKFLRPASSPVWGSAVMATYTAGQFLIADGATAGGAWATT